MTFTPTADQTADAAVARDAGPTDVAVTLRAAEKVRGSKLLSDSCVASAPCMFAASMVAVIATLADEREREMLEGDTPCSCAARRIL